MFILKFKVVNTNEKELAIVDYFCQYLKTIIYNEIDNKLNRIKIGLRIPYIYKVPWIQWTEKYISVDDILKTMYKSITFDKHDKNEYVIKIETNTLIPNTTTSMDRLIRFLEYGDLNFKGLGIITKLEHKYNFNRLYGLWSVFCIQQLGYQPLSYIIGVQ